jgi:hypothetical protein
MSDKEESVFIPNDEALLVEEEEKLEEVQLVEKEEVKLEEVQLVEKEEVKLEEVVQEEKPVKEEVVEEEKPVKEEVIEEEKPVKEEVNVVGQEVNVVEEDEFFPDFTDKTLAEVFLYILKKNYKLNKAREMYYKKIGITLNKDIIEIMNKIININPTFLSEVEQSILNIVKDNKIDSSDIPEFITLLQMLYEKLYNLKDYNLDNSKLSETSSTIIKFILHALVEEKKIVIDDDKKILFLSQFDKLIDSCMNLLHFHHNLKAKDCCTIM